MYILLKVNQSIGEAFYRNLDTPAHRKIHRPFSPNPANLLTSERAKKSPLTVFNLVRYIERWHHFLPLTGAL